MRGSGRTRCTILSFPSTLYYKRIIIPLYGNYIPVTDLRIKMNSKRKKQSENRKKRDGNFWDILSFCPYVQSTVPRVDIKVDKSFDSVLLTNSGPLDPTSLLVPRTFIGDVGSEPFTLGPRTLLFCFVHVFISFIIFRTIPHCLYENTKFVKMTSNYSPTLKIPHEVPWVPQR